MQWQRNASSTSISIGCCQSTHKVSHTKWSKHRSTLFFHPIESFKPFVICVCVCVCAYFFLIQNCLNSDFFSANRTILKDVPVIEGITTIHFPDIEAAYFRSLLDFLYSGQTCVPAADVEHLHDLLDLLQIKPGVWRTGDKNGKETIEVLTRIFTENNQKLDAHHTITDLNCNQNDEDIDGTRHDDQTHGSSHRSKSRDSSPSQHYVKMEQLNESSCDDERDDDDDLNVDEEQPSIELRRHRRKKISNANSGGKFKLILTRTFVQIF